MIANRMNLGEGKPLSSSPPETLDIVHDVKIKNCIMQKETVFFHYYHV